MATKKTTKQTAVKRTKTTKTTKKPFAAKLVSTKARSSKANILLGRLQLASALVFVVLAVLVGWLAKDNYYQLTTGYLTKDELARQSDAFLPAIRNLYDLNIKWALVAVLAASAIVPLLAISKLKNTYIQAVTSKVQTFRWIDSAVTWALLVELVAFLSGVHTLTTLKLIAVLVAVTMLLGWLSEKHKQARDNTAFILSLFTSLAVLIALAAALANTYIWGITNLPWFTYTAVGAAVFGLVLWQINHYNYLRGFRSWKNYEVVERNYLIINLATKSLIATALLIGLS